MKERPILVVVIGYIIGILWGLYFEFSIVPCYILIIATYYITRKYFKKQQNQKFKLLSLSRYSRYLKLIISKKVVYLLIISSVIANTIVLFQNNNYENAYQDGENIEEIGIIVSQKIEKPYYNLYQVKLLNSKHFNLFIQTAKKSEELEYGDKVKLQGEYKKANKQRNYGGYDEEKYLKTLKIIGKVKTNQIEVISKKQLNPILQFANSINLTIRDKIDLTLEKEKASILKSLLLGDTSNIEEEVKENFQIANISHILAVSGMHINYMIIGVQLLLKKAIGKRKTRIVTIIILIGYSFITGFSPSIIRAVVMGTLTIGAGIVYRKSDIWNAIAISLLGILLYNPFSILKVGLQLSYLGTIGMILFHQTFLRILNIKEPKKKSVLFEKLKETIAVSLAAQVTILPVMLYHFNIFGSYFLITNLLVSLVIGPILILGFFCIFISFIYFPMTPILAMLLKIGLEILNLIARFSELPFSKIYVPTPKIISIILYFIGIAVVNQIYTIYHLDYLRATHKRVKNLIALFRYRFHQKNKIYKRYILVTLMILTVIHFIPKDLRINFVDAGQGDCTFIVTPQNKTILIDGGGSLTEEFDVGRRTLIPYLLDRGYTTIDYVIISHFDKDHVRTDY